MKTKWVVLGGGVFILVAGILLVVVPAPKSAAPFGSGSQASSTTPAGPHNALPDLAIVTAPLPGATVTSPLTVEGEARGNFYFEAVFPVELKDAQGNTLVQGQARAQSDWTTNDFVPFVATLTFPSQPKGSAGILILKNDNPSGDPSKQKELDIPVKF